MHFISTSPNASISEQFHDFKKILEYVSSWLSLSLSSSISFFHGRSTHKDPIRVCDALTGQEVRVKLYKNAGPADNPMASEMASHIGSNGNFFCRKCHVGGTTKEKETDAGYHSLFAVCASQSSPRSFTDIFF